MARRMSEMLTMTSSLADAPPRRKELARLSHDQAQKLAAAKGLKTEVTAPFDESMGPAELKVSSSFDQLAFLLKGGLVQDRTNRLTELLNGLGELREFTTLGS